MGPGQPPIFDNPDDLQNKIDEYFESCKGTKDNPGQFLTITGLALYVGFESRQSFYDYEKRPEFSYIIKRARLQVENGYEQRLFGNNPTGPIFALKNMGWADKQEIEQKTEHSGGLSITGMNIV